MWRSKFDHTCRLCLKDSAELSLFENRISIKIMICLQVDVEENDNMPPRICVECRTLLEKIYLFRAKVHENDQTLRKLISVGQTTDTRFIESKNYLKQHEVFTSQSSLILSPTLQDHHSNLTEEHLDEYSHDDYEPMEDDQDYDRYSIEIVEDEPLHHSESSDTVDGSKFFTKNERLVKDDFKKSVKIEAAEPVNRSETLKIKKDEKIRINNKWFEHPGDEPDQLKHLTLPTNFPLKNVTEVNLLENWINESTNNYEKVVYVIRKKLSTSPDPTTGMKSLFSYNIAHGYVHPSGHRKENMISISDVRVFTDVLEEALRGCDNVDMKQLWKEFFRLGRNWIRTNRSRQKSRISQITADLN